jgi:hypothetical protein
MVENKVPTEKEFDRFKRYALIAIFNAPEVKLDVAMAAMVETLEISTDYARSIIFTLCSNGSVNSHYNALTSLVAVDTLDHSGSEALVEKMQDMQEKHESACAPANKLDAHIASMRKNLLRACEAGRKYLELEEVQKDESLRGAIFAAFAGVQESKLIPTIESTPLTDKRGRKPKEKAAAEAVEAILNK